MSKARAALVQEIGWRAMPDDDSTARQEEPTSDSEAPGSRHDRLDHVCYPTTQNAAGT